MSWQAGQPEVRALTNDRTKTASWRRADAGRSLVLLPTPSLAALIVGGRLLAVACLARAHMSAPTSGRMLRCFDQLVAASFSTLFRWTSWGPNQSCRSCDVGGGQAD